jgi:hypothetical protein
VGAQFCNAVTRKPCQMRFFETGLDAGWLSSGWGARVQ